MSKQYDFTVGQLVQFVEEAQRTFIHSGNYKGNFTVAEVVPVQSTCHDVFSDQYRGEQEGQDAVGHHQLVRLEGRENLVSGMWLEPVPSSDTHVWTEEDQFYFDQGVGELFDLLIDKVRSGEVSHAEADRFADVVSRPRTAV